MSFPEDLAERQAARSPSWLQVRVRAMVNTWMKRVLTIEVDKRNRFDRPRKTVVWAGGITASPLGKSWLAARKAETGRGGKVK